MKWEAADPDSVRLPIVAFSIQYDLEIQSTNDTIIASRMLTGKTRTLMDTLTHGRKLAHTLILTPIVHHTTPRTRKSLTEKSTLTTCQMMMMKGSILDASRVEWVEWAWEAWVGTRMRMKSSYRRHLQEEWVVVVVGADSPSVRLSRREVIADLLTGVLNIMDFCHEDLYATMLDKEMAYSPRLS